METENESPLAAAAENAAKRKLIIQPVIVTLLAAGLVGEILTVLPKFREEGITKLDNYAVFMLMIAVAIMLLRSVLKLVYILRDLRAAKAGTVRTQPGKEKAKLTVLAILAGCFILLGLLLAGWTAAQNANGNY